MAYRTLLLTWAFLFVLIVGAFLAGGTIASTGPVVMSTAETQDTGQ